MAVKNIWRSFAGGEIAPELAGRLDLTKYQTGLSLCRNFITLPHGPAARRPGFEYVQLAGDYNRKVRLIPFCFSADQTAVLEFGHLYVRFYVNGGTVVRSPVTISSITGNTVVTATAHGCVTGEFAYIGNDYCAVTVVNTTTITVTNVWNAPITPIGPTLRRVYVIASPYTENDLADLHYTQSADVVTLTHPNYAARELRRLAADSWELVTINFAPTMTPPTMAALTINGSAGTSNGQTYYYVATSVAKDGVTESLASAPTSGYNNLGNTGNSNTVTINGVSGADRYNVYKKRGGSYGFIGQVRQTPSSTLTISSIARSSDDKTVTVTTTAAHGRSTGDFVGIADTGVPSFHGYWAVTVVDSDTFTYESNSKSFAVSGAGTVIVGALSLVDDNILPDTTQTPPENLIELNVETGNYPTAVTYHEQRRWFAGTLLKPQVLWATRTGTESNLTSSLPSRDADGIEVRLVSPQYNAIRHLVPLADLIAFTAGGEFRIFADSAPAITPTSMTIKPQGYSGANNVQPAVTSGSVLYVQAQGSRVRELAYNWESNAYRSVDVSIMAPHRFNGYTITDLAYCRAPDQILWAIRDDGTLMGLSYVPDQQVYGWHAHDTTDGVFESVCAVAEGNEDVLYAVVRRTVNGTQRRYVERLRTRVFNELADAFFVDSGMTYDSTATGGEISGVIKNSLIPTVTAAITTVTGLTHLEGKLVHVLANGAQVAPRVVSNGQITLDVPATKIHIGLPITSDLRTLPVAIDGMQAGGQGTVKNVNQVHIRVASSAGCMAGPDFTHLRPQNTRDVTDPYGSPPALRTGEFSIKIDPSWNQDAAVCIRQDRPLPLTVLSLTLELQTGG